MQSHFYTPMLDKVAIIDHPKKNTSRLALMAITASAGTLAFFINSNSAYASDRVWSANSPDSIEIVENQPYTIKWGDTLWAISEKTGVSVEDIASSNQITDSDLIYEGNQVTVYNAETSDGGSSSNNVPSTSSTTDNSPNTTEPSTGSSVTIPSVESTTESSLEESSSSITSSESSSSVSSSSSSSTTSSSNSSRTKKKKTTPSSSYTPTDELPSYSGPRAKNMSTDVSGVNKVIQLSSESARINVRDVTIDEGSLWDASLAFLSAEDAYGNSLDYSSIIINGDVNTSEPGDYFVEYSYQGIKSVSIVRVLERTNYASITLRNSEVGFGSLWNPADNFVSATNSSGDEIGLDKLSVSGEVDTLTPGEYIVNYSVDNSIIVPVTITVKPSEENGMVSTEDLLTEVSLLSAEVSQEDDPTYSTDIVAISTSLFDKINSYREYKGLKRLTYDQTLNDVAIFRSEENATMNSIGHVRPDGSNWESLLYESGFSLVGENVMACFNRLDDEANATALFENWKTDAFYNEGMMSSDYENIGIGIYVDSGTVWSTQILSI